MNHRAAEVVITGISGRLPESDNIAEFREHLINGDDMSTVDDRRWEPGETKPLAFIMFRIKISRLNLLC